MSPDLELGFRNKPLDLTEVLQEQGFRLRLAARAELSEGCPEYRNYTWIDEQKSRRGVDINYLDGIEEDDEFFLKFEPKIVAKAIVTCYAGANAFDKQKQKDVARFLRDYYYAVLYNPKLGEEVKSPL